MRKKMRSICSVLVFSLFISIIFAVSVSAEEMGTWDAASEDGTIILQDQMPSDDASLPATEEPVADTDDLYVGDGELSEDSVDFEPVAEEPEGDSEDEGNTQPESKTTGEGEDELPEATVDFEPNEESSEENFEVVDNKDDIRNILPESETKNTIEIIVKNCGENSGALVIAPVEGWMEGTNTFTVSCSVPCVVLVSYDSGETYIRLPAQVMDGGYGFTVENLAQDAILTVLVLGDSNGDGCFTNADITRICSVYSGKASLDTLQGFACDVNGDGRFTNADVTMIRAAYANMAALDW